MPEIEIPIKEIVIGDRFRKEMGDLEGLARNIFEIGLLHPVVISEKNELIAGERRIRAFGILGRDKIPARIVSIKRLVDGEYSENIFRELFTPDEIAAIVVAMKPAETEKAKERQSKAGKTRGKGKIASGKLPEAIGDTRDIIGKAVGMSGKTIEKICKICDAAEKEPEKYEAIREEMNKTRNVDKALRAVQRIEKQEGMKPQDMPKGVFDVILADPPWEYDFFKSDSRSNDNQYPSMKTKDICEIKDPKGNPIPFAENAILFLWATAPKIREALKVMSAWGFEYKTNMVWVKDKMGLGYYARNKHEHLFIGTKGDFSPPLEKDRPVSVIEAPRTEHSKKPEKVYGIIESMYPQGKYLEVFARKNKRPDWTTWGNEE